MMSIPIDSGLMKPTYSSTDAQQGHVMECNA